MDTAISIPASCTRRSSLSRSGTFPQFPQPLVTRATHGQAGAIPQDGIKVFLDNSEWALVLPDGEEPFFHIYAEAGDHQRAGQLVADYRDTLETVISESQSSE